MHSGGGVDGAWAARWGSRSPLPVEVFFEAEHHHRDVRARLVLDVHLAGVEVCVCVSVCIVVCVRACACLCV